MAVIPMRDPPATGRTDRLERQLSYYDDEIQHLRQAIAAGSGEASGVTQRTLTIAGLLSASGLAFVITCEFFINKFIFVQKTIGFSHQEATLYAFGLAMALLLFSHMLGRFISHVRRIAHEEIIKHYHTFFSILTICLLALILVIAIMRGTGIQFNVSPTGIVGVGIDSFMEGLTPTHAGTDTLSVRQELLQLTLVISIFLLINSALALAGIWLSFRKGPEQLSGSEKNDRIRYLTRERERIERALSGDNFGDGNFFSRLKWLFRR